VVASIKNASPRGETFIGRYSSLRIY